MCTCPRMLRSSHNFLRFSAQKVLHWVPTTSILKVLTVTETQFVIRFPGASGTEADAYANDLRRALSDLDEHLKVEHQRSRVGVEDRDPALVMILGAVSTSALAHAIAAWLERHHGVSLQISRDGSVITSNLDSGNSKRLVELFGKDALPGASGILPGDSGKDDD
jgi:hypothetical protein